jgi:acetyl coenzyme A synthetase (ADP forming)-like protein
MSHSDDSLLPYFNPKGVAVIGASSNPIKLGYGLARNLVQSNYQGVVHFVNPRGGGLMGRPIYTQISKVPDPVDLAIILIPALAVPKTLKECGERGIRAVIISSGGFREVSPEGADLEDQCLQIAKTYGMRLLGPNCIGILDTHLPLDATFLPPPGPLPGDVAFISHSGAICAAVIDWARGQGFGLSRLVSLGNQADITEADVLSPVAADPYTRVLTLYLEGVSDGCRFVAEASKLTRQKPIIALKVGRYASGQRAVASHTGALAGQESAYNAAFRRAGVIRADTNEEMFDWARALAWCPLPKNRSMAVLTNAGGPGVTATDALESLGMKIAELEDGTHSALGEILPPVASLYNPVDMLASATPEQYAQCLQVLLSDSGVDGVLIILPPPPMHTAGAVAKSLIPIIHNADKPVVIALMGERLIQEAVEHFRAARIPEYRFPERAASALAVLVQRAEFLRRQQELPEHRSDVDMGVVRQALNQHTLKSTAATGKTNVAVSQEIIHHILEAYKIPTMQMMLAKSPNEAAQLARGIGFPVVLKISSPDIPHKSDVGGIILELNDEQAVVGAFSTILENARTAQPNAVIEGIHVQRMVTKGQEVIVGAVQDPQFGPIVMFGSGGVEVEGLRDISFALAPLTNEEANHLLESTWAGRKLHGYRNMPPADRAGVIEVLIRLAQLAADFPELEEIEINPLRVLSSGAGTIAIDVRAQIGTLPIAD